MPLAGKYPLWVVSASWIWSLGAKAAISGSDIAARKDINEGRIFSLGCF